MMAKRKAKEATPPRAKSKPAKAAPKGSPMLKRLFLLATFGALGYVSVAVPIDGRTAARRAYDALPWEVVPKHVSHPAVAQTTARKKPAAPAKPAEKLTQADRDALERLLPH